MLHAFSTTATALPGEPPAEFRIFRKGLNPSTKGTVLFDSEAAAMVMAKAAEWGIDYIVDLQHHSLDARAQAARADAEDARAWFRLELRDGELWGVDVRWTADGERRIRERLQRYISPAFNADPETGRVTELVNVGLVSMPATHSAQALIAASRTADDRAAARVRGKQYYTQAVERRANRQGPPHATHT